MRFPKRVMLILFENNTAHTKWKIEFKRPDLSW